VKSKSDAHFVIAAVAGNGERTKRYSLDNSNVQPKGPLGDGGLIFRKNLAALRTGSHHSSALAEGTEGVEGTYRDTDTRVKGSAQDILTGLAERRASTQLWVVSQLERVKEEEGREKAGIDENMVKEEEEIVQKGKKMTPIEEEGSPTPQKRSSPDKPVGAVPPRDDVVADKVTDPLEGFRKGSIDSEYGHVDGPDGDAEGNGKAFG
jgi:hypothetical protein